MTVDSPSRLRSGSFLSLSILAFACSTTPRPAGSDTKQPLAEAAGSGGAAVENAAPGPATGQDQETLRTQQRNFLIRRAIERANGLIARLDYEEAKAELLKAREYDPDHPELNRLLQVVLEQLGERQGEIESYQDFMTKLLEIRIQKERADSRRLIDEAKEAMAELDYAGAIDKLKRVELRVKIGVNVDWEEIPETVASLLDKARNDQKTAAETARRTAERESFLDLQRQAAARRARIKRQVHYLLGKASRAFEAYDFTAALRFAEAALRVQPTHPQARDMVAASQKALRSSRHDSYIRDKAAAYKRFIEDAEERKIAYTDILVGPDQDYWESTRSRRIAATDELEIRKDDETLAIEGQLDKILLPKGLSFGEGESGFAEVVDTLNRLSSVPILISPEAREKIDTNSLTLTITLEAPITLRNFLNVMVERSASVSEEAGDALAYMTQNGVVLLTTRNKALGKPILKVHSIADLTFSMASFAGPQIKDIPVATEEDEEKPRAGGEVGERVKFIDPEILVEMIQKTVARGTWEDTATIEAVGGNLLVIHTPEVHQKVAQFLNDLRKFQTSLVTVESKFLRVSRNWLESFGVDFRGLGGANAKGTEAELDDVTNKLDDNASRGLDNNGQGSDAGHPVAGFFYDDGLDGDFRGRTENFFTNALGSALSTRGGATFGFTLLDDVQLNGILRAIRKSTNVQLVDAQTLTVLNAQRASVSVIRQTAYIKDFNVEVANAAFIADPEVDVIQDGIVLDVRPMISYDRKYITLDLQPTIAELVRPIPTFTTSLAGATLPVTLQFPQLTVRSAETTVKVPDGGSVLIGGLNEVLNRERRAQVPWLAHLPLVSFLFKEEGVVDENSSLMILVKAYVTNVTEFMSDSTR